MDQLHLLRFIECNVSLTNNIWCNFRLVHNLLHQRIIHRSYVIRIVIGLQDGVQNGMAHVE